MKRYTYERKIAYLLMHQICMIAMVICIYTYEYIVLKNPEKNEFYYLIVSFIGLLGGIGFLLLASRIESRLCKKAYKKSIVDRCYPEILLLITILLILIFGNNRED